MARLRTIGLSIFQTTPRYDAGFRPANSEIAQMAVIPVKLANGRTVEFDVREGLESPALFLLSVRKCGSSIFYKIAHAMARANNCNYVNVGGTFFTANIVSNDYVNDAGLVDIIRRGNVYGGFRDMPAALLATPLFRKAPKLLMIRDPRDALVSQYFSNAYSHPIPCAAGPHADVVKQMERQRAETRKMAVEDYVLRQARAMKHTMLRYRPVAGKAQTTVLKYEDYIFDKRRLMGVIAEKFGWRADEELVRGILEWADVRPENENPTSFIRKVTPGDHREKLSAAAISSVNEILEPALRFFDYPF